MSESVHHFFERLTFTTFYLLFCFINASIEFLHRIRRCSIIHIFPCVKFLSVNLANITNKTGLVFLA